MIRVLRHVLSILLLPTVVTIVVPWWLIGSGDAPPTFPESFGAWAAACFGVLLFAAGVTLFVGSLRRFDADGHGTLAPWDPPGDLVVRGPYAYVRNPMISGVVLVLFSEAAVLRSVSLLEWAAAFAVLNAIHIPLFEEPGLRARFGTAYEAYCQSVPRLVPRLRPVKIPDSGNETRRVDG